MRLHVMSDLHFEYYPDYGASIIEAVVPNADALVLAGDLFSWHPKKYQRNLAALKAFKAKYETIIYVPGNHEYWDCLPEEVDDDLVDVVKDLGIHVLREGHPVVIKGQTFRGDTMWFPYELVDPLMAKSWIDFKMVWALHDYAYRKNSVFRQNVLFDGKPDDVIITHHAPSYRSIAPQWERSPYNCFFVSPEDKILDLVRPKLWIHGHTHTSFDYTVGDTRVVCNPRGYPHEGQDARWDPAKIIEV